MDDEVHVIDLRMKCVLVVLRYLLVLLLKYSTQRHKDCKNKTSLGVGMAEVYKGNETKLKKKKSFYTDWTIGNFYNIVPPASASGGVTHTLKPKFNVDELDFAVMCDLLLAEDFSTLSKDKCCGSCKHDCLTCGPGKCKQTGGCRYKVCSCAKDCIFLQCKVFILIAKALRNTNAHSTFEMYDNFEKKKLSFMLFPTFPSWEDIWKKVDAVAEACFQLMITKKLLNQEEYKDKKMELRLALHKKKNHLIPVVGDFIKDFYRNIVRKEELSGELKMMNQKLSYILEGRCCSGKCLDSVWYEDKMISFNDPLNESITIDLKASTIEKISFSCKVALDFKLLLVQAKTKGKGWFPIPREMHRSHQDGCNFHVEFTELNSTKSYSFRLLGIDTKNKQQYVLSCSSIKPIDPICVVECHGTRVSIAQEQKLTIHQMIENGVVFESHPLLAKENVVTVQYSEDQKTWLEINEDQYDVHSTQLVIQNLAGIMTCDVRAIVENDQGNTLLSINNVNLADKHDLNHVAVESTPDKRILAFFHAYGFPKDLHQLIHMGRLVDTTKIKHFQQGGGSVSELLSTADDYIQNNYNDIPIVEFHGRLHQRHEKQLNGSLENVVQMFRAYFEQHYPSVNNATLNPKFVYLTGYDMVYHIRNLTKRLNLDDFDLSLSEDLNSHLIIFSTEMRAIINVYICDGSTKEDLCQAYRNCHDQLKALTIVFNDLMMKGLFVFIGVVATRQLETKQAEDIQFCRTNPSICNLFTIPVTDQAATSSDVFHEKLTEMFAFVNETALRNTGKSFPEARKEFLQLPNRLMVISSLECIQHPAAFGDLHEKILTLVFNKEQKNALDNPSKKKLVQGPYGCGKTSVCQKSLENCLENANSTEEIFCYISCDEYSLLHCDNKRYCQALEQKHKKKIICMSVDEISQEYGSSSILPLTKCLQHLASKYKGHKINVFVDEIDPEDLTGAEITRLNDLFEESCYASSTVVMNLQSISKHRIYGNMKSYTHKYRIFAGDNLKMVVFTLPKIMRYTTSIHEIMEAVQALISQHNSIYSQLAMSEELASSLDESYYGSEELHQGPNLVHFDETDSVNQPHLEKLPLDSTDPKLELSKASIAIDTLAKLCSGTENLSSGETQKDDIATFFSFPDSKGCRHRIIGTRPILVRNVCTVSAIPDNKSSATLARELDMVFKPKWRNSMVIASSLDIVRVAYRALRALRLDVVVYVEALTCNFPSRGLKDEIFSQWSGKRNSVLLTDHRGCRGLQHDKVALLLDEEENIEHFLLPETIGRSISDITMFSFNGSKKSIQSSSRKPKELTVGKILDHLEERELVIIQKFHDFDLSIYMERIEETSTVNFERRITKSKVEMLYREQFISKIDRLNDKELRKLFVQHRVYELANYLASKELNSTLYKDEVGDELFDLCTEMILANHALFKGTASTFSSPEAQIMIFAEVLKEFHAGTLLTVFSVVLYQVRHTKTNHDMSSLSIAISTHSDAITEQGGLDALITGFSSKLKSEEPFIGWKILNRVLSLLA